MKMILILNKKVMSLEFNRFRDHIKTLGLRLTPQRVLIFEVFLQTEGHFSVEKLFQKASDLDPQIGIATVYRTMKLLTACSLAREFIMPNGSILFEKSSTQEQHDHLVCEVCGKIIEFEHPKIRQYQEEVAQSRGFSIYYHRLTLIGICEDCKK